MEGNSSYLFDRATHTNDTSKRTAETNRVWVVTVNSANVTGLISFSGLYSTGHGR